MQHLMMFLQILGVAVNHLSYQYAVLQQVDQLFPTLMKLQPAKDDSEFS